MKKRLKKPILASFGLTLAAMVALVVSSSFALAQSVIDPSSALLLNSGNRTSSERPGSGSDARSDSRPDSRLDSGRYTTRPRDRTERSTLVQPTPTPARRVAPAVSPTPAPPPANSQLEVTVNPSDENGTVVVPIAESVDSPDSSRVIEGRKEGLLEVGLGSGFLYENSTSSYSYRQYSMAAPIYSVDAKVWLSSDFGVGASTYSTMGATVSDGTRDLAATRSEISAGLYYRNYISNERVFLVGVEFQDQQLRIPTDATTKLKLKTTGVRLSVQGVWDSWRMGFSVAPKLDHEETADAGTRSGSSVEAYRVGFEIGRRWPFSSTNAMHIRLRHDVEQASFSGPATSPDRVTGATPDGVGVTSGTTVIQFGFDWGQ